VLPAEPPLEGVPASVVLEVPPLLALVPPLLEPPVEVVPPAPPSGAPPVPPVSSTTAPSPGELQAATLVLKSTKIPKGNTDR